MKKGMAIPNHTSHTNNPTREPETEAENIEEKRAPKPGTEHKNKDIDRGKPTPGR